MTHNHVQELNESDFQQVASEGLVLVDFWAPWCGPCRMMAPVLDEVAQKTTQAKITKVNVDQNPRLADRFGVQAIPVLILLKDGEEVKRFVGVQPVNLLSDAIQAHAG